MSSSVSPVGRAICNLLGGAFSGRGLDAKHCKTTITARDQPAQKTPVTIEELAISPGHWLDWDFPRTEEARSSNLLTSTAFEADFSFLGRRCIWRTATRMFLGARSGLRPLTGAPRAVAICGASSLCSSVACVFDADLRRDPALVDEKPPSVERNRMRVHAPPTITDVIASAQRTSTLGLIVTAS